jgi:hypothetical protein
MGGGGGEEFQAILTKGNLEEEHEPNLDQVIDNIQAKPVEPMVLIIEFQ